MIHHSVMFPVICLDNSYTGLPVAWMGTSTSCPGSLVCHPAPTNQPLLVVGCGLRLIELSDYIACNVATRLEVSLPLS